MEEEGDGQLYSSWLIKWRNCSCGDGEWTAADRSLCLRSHQCAIHSLGHSCGKHVFSLFLDLRSTPSPSNSRSNIQTVSLSVTIPWNQHFWCTHRSPWHWPDVFNCCSMKVATSATSVLFFLCQSCFLLKILSRVHLLSTIPCDSASKLSI